MSLAYLQAETTKTHPDDIWALKWTQTNHIISGCADGHLRVFDAGEPSVAMHDLALHPLAVTSLSVTKDGRRALSASLDGTLVLMHPKEGRVLGKLETGREEVGAYACALHPEGTSYAWSGRSSKVVIRSMGAVDEAENGTEEDISDNKESTVGLGPLNSEGAVVEAGKGKFGMALEYSPDGRQIAMSTETGHVVIIDTESQAVVADYSSHAMPARSIAWSEDSQWLYSGSDDTRIVLHDVRTGSGSRPGEGAVGIMQGHQSWVLNLSADGRLLGSTGADRNVKLWDIAQRSAVYTTSLAAPAWAFDWQPADVQIGSLGPSKQFAVGGDEKTVMLYRAAGSV